MSRRRGRGAPSSPWTGNDLEAARRYGYPIHYTRSARYGRLDELEDRVAVLEGVLALVLGLEPRRR